MKNLILILLLFVGCATSETPKLNKKHFSIISDLHITRDGIIPPSVSDGISNIVDERPAFVILAGDATSGILKEAVTHENVKKYWKSVMKALDPIMKENIPIFPISGNHDAYQELHRIGYFENWINYESVLKTYNLHAGDKDFVKFPYSYSVDIEKIHFAFIHFVSPDFHQDIIDWLDNDLKNSTAKIKIVVGHVPLIGVSDRLKDKSITQVKIEEVLRKNSVYAYLCGHEHFFWDELFNGNGKENNRLRQIITGSLGADYMQTLSPETMVRAECKDAANNEKKCLMPYERKSFYLKMWKNDYNKSEGWAEKKRWT